jgi:hypothetical protein
LLEPPYIGGTHVDPRTDSTDALEDRVAELERRVAALESGRSPDPLVSDVSPATLSVPAVVPDAMPEAPLTVSLVRKNFHKANLPAGDAGDRIDFALRFTSRLTKDLRAFKGAIVFRDLFGEKVFSLTLTHESELKAGGSSSWEGGFGYNQFLPQHQRLLSAQDKNLTTDFDLEAVVYADGATERFRQ